MPQFQSIRFFCEIAYSIVLLASNFLSRYTRATIHKYTYRSTEDPLNVVVIGASFAGWYLLRELSRSLPSGYRVILIERNSHFHYTWLFPRTTVVPGHEDKTFIPYPCLPSL